MMDPLDRELLLITAEGVNALLREYTERFDPPGKVLVYAKFVQSRLSNLLTKASVPMAGSPDTQGRKLAALCYDKIAASPEGATCDEIEARYGLRHQSASPRIHELKAEGKVRDSGRKRETRSGHWATVWIKGGTNL